MILIDALHINTGGGLILLKYLVSNLRVMGKEFFLLYDVRCSGLFNEVIQKQTIVPSQKNRLAFYKKHFNCFTTVLCFANVPPPIKLNVPVYTYFHNILLMTLGVQGFKTKFKCWLKRSCLFLIKRNTDKWVVQTSNTANELKKHLHLEDVDIITLPFFDMSQINYRKDHGNDYLFVGDYTGYKGHDELLKAWIILFQKGFRATLHLTCSHTQKFLSKIEAAKIEGIDVVNHGFIPFTEIIDLYYKCKAIVYPSSNESFGLGIVEAIKSGCDVIASDLPFTYAICEPSAVFDPKTPESIAKAIQEYEMGNSKRSSLKVNDEVLNLINLLK